MKINLILNSNDIRSGYINVDPFAEPGDPDRVACGLWNLGEIADDGEVIDLLALDVIDFIPSTETNDVLAGWLRKLRHGGTITVGGIDIYEVSHAFASRRLNLTEANLLLYGTQDTPADYRKATLTIQHMIEALKTQGMKLERKQVEDYHYYVTARRP